MSRRDLLKCAAAAPAVVSLSSLLAAQANAAPLGSCSTTRPAWISAADIRPRGHGAIRYVRPQARGAVDARQADPAPGGPRPVSEISRSSPATSTASRTPRTGWAGRTRASITRSGAGSYTSPRAVRTAPRSTRRSTTIRHLSSTNSRLRPIRGWEAVVLGHQRVGVYANSKTIDWALQDGLGSYLWQHNWGRRRAHASRRAPPPGRDRQAQRRRHRRGHQPHPQAPVRAMGLRLTGQ